MAKSRKKDTALYAIIAILLIIILVGVPFMLMWNSGLKEAVFDADAQAGRADYKTHDEMVAELNEIVNQGMLTIAIQNNLEFENGTSEAVANIENPPSNTFVTKVIITLDKTGEVVYESGGLEPGKFIEKIKLNKDLDPGTYPATAEFQAFDPKDLKQRGSTSGQITITVEH